MTSTSDAIPLSKTAITSFEHNLFRLFDDALVDSILAIKVNNIHLERVLTPTDRAYIRTYFAFYHFFSIVGSFGFDAAMSCYVNKRMPQLPMILGIASHVSFEVIQKHFPHVNKFPAWMVQAIYPRLDPNTSTYKYALSYVQTAFFVCLTAASLLISFFDLQAVEQFISKRGVVAILMSVFGIFYSLTAHSIMNLLTPTIVSIFMQHPHVTAKHEDYYSPNDAPAWFHDLGAIQAKICDDIERLEVNNWKRQPDSFMSARYRLSERLNPTTDEANGKILPGYKSSAEERANTIYRQHKDANTLGELRTKLKDDFVSLDDVISRALKALKPSYQQKIQEHFPTKTGGFESLEYVAEKFSERIMQKVLSEHYQRSVCQDELQTLKYDFWYSMVSQGYSLIPLKQSDVLPGKEPALKSSVSNLTDFLGQQSTIEAAYRASNTPKNLRSQTSMVSTRATVDIQNFLRLVDTLSSCKNILFRPVSGSLGALSQQKKAY